MTDITHTHGSITGNLTVIEQRVERIENMLTYIVNLLEKYEPLLDKYQRASQANGWRQQRKAMQS